METTKADEVAIEIEHSILRGEMPAGTVLRQDDLSARLGVSRTPVREALRLLAASGLVQLTPNRGARVRPVSRSYFRDASEIRASLESLAAELAAVRIEEADLRRIRRAHEEFSALTHRLRLETDRGGDPRALARVWIGSNDAFHDITLESARSARLARMARSVRHVFAGELTWAADPANHWLFEQSLAEHAAIVEALEVGNPGAARALMQAHILATGELVDRFLVDRAAAPKFGSQK